MPLYEFHCKKCDEKFETLLTIKELDNPVECPKCKSKNTERLISTFSASVSSSTTKGSSCSTSGST